VIDQAQTEQDVTFDGATGPLRGRLGSPTGTAWGSLVLCHGRHETMEGPMVSTLARRAADLGLWTLRFNFAFIADGSDPSPDHEDEIADLREACAFAAAKSGFGAAFIAGRGLGAWACVGAATGELAAGAILLGLAYTGQPDRRRALERLEEFEIPTIVVVGFESDRVDLPRLRVLISRMTSVNLEIVARADHRLQDPAGRPMTEAALMPVEAWLRLRRKERESR
jgi:alpha/beta superfamily hydrolase